MRAVGAETFDRRDVSCPRRQPAEVMHERTASPSRCTVHAPQAPMPQPNFVPVMPSMSLIAHKQRHLGIGVDVDRPSVNPKSHGEVSFNIRGDEQRGRLDMDVRQTSEGGAARRLVNSIDFAGKARLKSGFLSRDQARARSSRDRRSRAQFL